MKGWLLDTHVVSALASPNGAPSVKAWAASQTEHSMYLSVLTLAEIDKGIHNLDPESPDRSRYLAARAALESVAKGVVGSVPGFRKWSEPAAAST